MNKEPYSLLKFIGGVCAIAGGALFLTSGAEGSSFDLFFGVISLILGAALFFSLAKNNFDKRNKK